VGGLPGPVQSGRFDGVSTTATRVIELVKSLPEVDQRAIRQALNRQRPQPTRARRKLQRQPDGSYYNPDGVPNDDPFFKIMEEIEGERHRALGPAAPDFG
jgi:hypothetical protein